MKIDGTNTANMGMNSGMAQGTDAMSRELQHQIQAKQQELQKLAENEHLSMEEKMKKRQEIQQEISDLNMQLRTHQLEVRREQQSKAASNGNSMEEMLGGNPNRSNGAGKGKGTGMSQSAMTAIISADSSMKIARVQGNVSEQMEGRARVLKAEIKQDAASGTDTTRKKEELAKVEKKADSARASQLSTIGEANRTLEEAREKEAETEKEDNEEGKRGKKTSDKKGVKADGKYKNRMADLETKETEKEDIKEDIIEDSKEGIRGISKEDRKEVSKEGRNDIPKEIAISMELNHEDKKEPLPADYVKIDVRL